MPQAVLVAAPAAIGLNLRPISKARLAGSRSGDDLARPAGSDRASYRPILDFGRGDLEKGRA
jgi:hypothetical protein